MTIHVKPSMTKLARFGNHNLEEICSCALSFIICWALRKWCELIGMLTDIYFNQHEAARHMKKFLVKRQSPNVRLGAKYGNLGAEDKKYLEKCR